MQVGSEMFLFLVQWEPSVPELKKPCIKWKTPLQAPLKNNTLLGVEAKGGTGKMLTMEQVYVSETWRNWRKESRKKYLQITGHDFETVQEVFEKEDFNQLIRPKQRRYGKLSPYKNIVTTWLVKDKKAPYKQQHTAKRVFDRLKEMYGDEFTASDRAVRKFVADIRKELQNNTDGFLPLEHPPGEAQADFGEARCMENGVTYDGYYFNMSYA